MEVVAVKRQLVRYLSECKTKVHTTMKNTDIRFPKRHNSASTILPPPLPNKDYTGGVRQSSEEEYEESDNGWGSDFDDEDCESENSDNIPISTDEALARVEHRPKSVSDIHGNEAVVSREVRRHSSALQDELQRKLAILSHAEDHSQDSMEENEYCNLPSPLVNHNESSTCNMGNRLGTNSSGPELLAKTKPSVPLKPSVLKQMNSGRSLSQSSLPFADQVISTTLQRPSHKPPPPPVKPAFINELKRTITEIPTIGNLYTPERNSSVNSSLDTTNLDSQSNKSPSYRSESPTSDYEAIEQPSDQENYEIPDSKGKWSSSSSVISSSGGSSSGSFDRVPPLVRSQPRSASCLPMAAVQLPPLPSRNKTMSDEGGSGECAQLERSNSLTSSISLPICPGGGATGNAVAPMPVKYVRAASNSSMQDAPQSTQSSRSRSSSDLAKSGLISNLTTRLTTKAHQIISDIKENKLATSHGSRMGSMQSINSEESALAGKRCGSISSLQRKSNMATRPLPPVPSSNGKLNNNDTVTVNSNELSPLDPGRRLDEFDWFHRVDRDKATAMLNQVGQDGTYLVRESQRGGQDSPYTLSVYYERKPFHLNIRIRPDSTYALGKEKPLEKTFDSLSELVYFHQSESIILTSNGVAAGKTCLLRTPK